MKTNEKPNYKKFEREEDKAFYAAYLNTAKQNVFITIRDISESLGLNFNLNNDNNMLNAGLWKKLASNKEPELSQAIIEKIKQKFPFANNLAVSYAYVSRKEISAEPNDFNKVFELLINQLNSYRNYYSHAVHKPVGTHSSLITGMKKLFDASRIKVKKRFNLKTEQVNHLVRLGRGSKEMENFKYSFLNHNNEISEKGFLFFVCLWLQRKDAQEFLKKHQGFKRSESKSQKATLEVFTYFSIRLPHPKLKSDNSKLSVFLDIINELNRCPKEIYPLLNDSDREKFKFVDDENIAGNDDEYEAMPILKRSSNRFFYFALRYLDSTFKYFKFHIDLGNYCFHVYDKEIEGIARNRKWIKRMLSFGNLEDFADEKRPREWKEKVQKIEDKQNGSKDIYVTETTPHYHINGNNIGIKFIGNYETVKKKNSIWPALPEFDKSNNEIPNPTKPANCPPDCWLSLYELPAIVFYQLLYHNNIAKYSAENIISDHRKKIKKFFSDIENGSLTNNFTDETLKQELKNYGLEISNIPKGIIKHLTSKQTKDFYYKANRRLEDFFAETKELISKVERQEGHYKQSTASKDYVEMKCGNMADFVARDMIRLQKNIGKDGGKPNSTEFQILQAKLAFFGKNKDTLHDTFKLFKLIDSENQHPFLNKIDINSTNGILDFYKEYLSQRKKYLEQCISEKKYDEYHFLKLGDKQKQSGQKHIEELATKLKNEVVMNLPRGLFLKPILEALKSSEKTNKLALELENTGRVNTAYIIDQYFTKIMNDKSQELYGYSKSYEFLNKIFDNRKEDKMRNALPSKYFTTEELTKMAINNEIENKLHESITKQIKKKRINNEIEIERIKEVYKKGYKYFTNNEKQIRLAKTTDKILFMMADEVFRKEFVTDNGLIKSGKNNSSQYQTSVSIDIGYKLAEIRPDSDKGILSLRTKVSLLMPYTYETNKDKILGLYNAKSIRSENKMKTIVNETIKIKNYGNFRGFLKDRRISSLMPYITDNEVQFEAVKKELEEFGKARIEIFKKIYEFEKIVIKEKELNLNAIPYINHGDILKSLIDEKDERFIIIKQLRDAFSHSNYPDYLLFENNINGEGFNELKNYTSKRKDILNNSIAYQFKNLTIKYYDELIKLATGK